MDVARRWLVTRLPAVVFISSLTPLSGLSRADPTQPHVRAFVRELRGLKTAKAIGLTLSRSLVLRADHRIE